MDAYLHIITEQLVAIYQSISVNLLKGAVKITLVQWIT